MYIDMHCDSLMIAALADKKHELRDSDMTRVDFERMKQSGALAQFFAIFMPDEKCYKALDMKPLKDIEYFDVLYEQYLTSLEKNSDIIRKAYSAQDVEENYRKGYMSSILTIEDGRLTKGYIERLDDFHDLGVRAISLTWNSPNCYGFPHSSDHDDMMLGLTPFGMEAVEYMNEIGIMVDVSHLSDGGFWDVATISKTPMIASHSNCRELCRHTRNLSDDMIRALANKGGVMGLNFCPYFLNEYLDDPNSRVETMIAHLKHMVKIGGIGVAALGSDFDGFRGRMEINDCGEYYKLFDAMKKAGFTEGQIDKIMYENVLRVMRDSMW